VAIVSTRELGIDPEKVNPDGGAIALSHPVDMRVPASCWTWRSSWGVAEVRRRRRRCAAAVVRATR
jgi:hypothetical protein